MIEQFLSMNEATKAETVESFYEAFYENCQSQDFSSLLNEQYIFQLIQQYNHMRYDYQKAYMPLLLGALLDQKHYQKEHLLNGTIAPFIIGQLQTLHDFRVKDDDNRFIHHINHFSYLIESLINTEKLKEEVKARLAQALFNAYQRNENVYFANEAILVANCMLQSFNSEQISILLEQNQDVQNDNLNEIWLKKRTNFNALWQNMALINQHKNYVDQAPFDQFSKLHFEAYLT